MIKKILILMVLISALFIFGCGEETPENLKEFATCLSDNGARMFGSATCPHCIDQKELFAGAFKYVDYTECSIQQKKCADEGIKYLPTWKFADGTVVTGLKTFSFLADKTGCTAP